MKVKILSTLSIVDDMGQSILEKDMEQPVIDELKRLHKIYRADVARYVESVYHKPDESDYERAMKVI